MESNIDAIQRSEILSEDERTKYSDMHGLRLSSYSVSLSISSENPPCKHAEASPRMTPGISRTWQSWAISRRCPTP